MDLDAAINGTWWLPETPAATVRGVLETDDNGMFVLRTTKPAAPPGTGSVAWDNDDDDDPYVMPFRPMLHGRSTAGVAVTLIGCHCVRRSIPLGGPASGEEAWRVEAIVLGCWLDAPDELMSEVRVELGSLFEWSHGSGPAVSVTEDRDQTTVTGRTAILGVAKLDGATLTLRSDCYFGYERSTATLNQLVRLVFEPKEGITLRSAMDDLVFPVRDLLALMTGDYVAVRSVEARPAVVVEAAQSVQVRYLAPLQRPYRRRQPREAHEMLATLANLDFPFEQLLPSWFHLRERHRTAVAMLLIPTHAPYVYADSQLLTAWLALEAYHDVAIGGTAVPADKHKARVDAIVSAAPPEHREWARDMLGGKKPDRCEASTGRDHQACRRNGRVDHEGEGQLRQSGRRWPSKGRASHFGDRRSWC